MAGPWILEGEPKKRFSCFGRLCQHARTTARNRRAPVKVRYLGPRGKGANRDPMRTDFLMRQDGTKDQRIDPTWWQNQKQGRK